VAARPVHLGAEYGEQFQDASVAAAYRTRPPYPAALFEILAGLLPDSVSAALDLGCGTGRIAIPLSFYVSRVDAVDPSAAMLEAAKSAGGCLDNIRWIHESAETYAYSESYGLVVTAASLHWMEWEVVLPKIREALRRDAVLAIVDSASFEDAPWREELLNLIPKHSTNQDYRRFHLLETLCNQGLFEVVGHAATRPREFAQTMDDYVLSFHSRNGFSRERMSPDSARAFDAAVRKIVRPFAQDGLLRTSVTASVTWGLPRPTQRGTAAG
jgi:SAM-dependent methyltransferase